MNPRARIAALRRAGLTLVELLVVLSVIGLLAALLLPAIRGARVAAGRIACGNNLRQLGFALTAYEAAEGFLPPAWNWSAHTHLLTQMEQLSLHDAFNFQQDQGAEANGTVRQVSIAVLLCPVDFGLGRDGGWTNYPVNTGCPYRPGSLLGAFGSIVSFRDFTDGTSQTAAIAEWVITSSGMGWSDPGRTFHLPSLVPFLLEDIDRFAARCAALDVATAEAGGGKGGCWIDGVASSTLYNHALPPNGKSCSEGNTATVGAWTAGSRHPGGANTLFADGHVAFVRESIALAAWRAMGSRGGGEAISGSEF